MRASLVFARIALVYSISTVALGKATQETQEPVPVVFQRLQSQSPAEKGEAAAQLLKRGRSDPEVKEYLAVHLPPLIDKGPARKDYPGDWITLVRLARELRIAEAAPALTKWLTIDNIGEITTAGFINLENNPAGKALAEIGDPAMPPLTKVFDHGTLRERRYAVYVLRLINSPSAKSMLREQMNREPDEGLRDFIQKTLAS
jgi:hypothetical protein